MILAGIREADATGLEAFEDSEIGDTDDDGMPEILDPWGRPIYFLRWAPGYVSALQDPQRPRARPVRSADAWIRGGKTMSTATLRRNSTIPSRFTR